MERNFQKANKSGDGIWYNNTKTYGDSKVQQQK
jgi:hypothetical protein